MQLLVGVRPRARCSGNKSGPDPDRGPLIVIRKHKPSMASNANAVAHLVPFRLAPSLLLGMGSNLQDSGKNKQCENSVRAVQYKCGNCDSKREEENRAVAGGRGRKQFYFKTGDTWLEVRKLGLIQFGPASFLLWE